MYSFKKSPEPNVKPSKRNVTKEHLKYVVKLLNIPCHVFKFTDSRYSSMSSNAKEFANHFESNQWFHIYKHKTAEYKHHPLQHLETSVRHFDLRDSLASEMQAQGNRPFYSKVCPNVIQRTSKSFSADLTTLKSLSTVTKSANYLQQTIIARNNFINNSSSERPLLHPEKPVQARSCYVRGYSRVIDASDYGDWDRFRQELRDMKHIGAGLEDNEHGGDVLLVALSYKSREVSVAKRMRFFNEDGSLAENEVFDLNESLELNSDFLDDFRWSQVVRMCMTLAEKEGKSGVRIWIDRLVMMNRSNEERNAIYNVVNWEDFGLFAFAMCPVVRVYDNTEKEVGKDFWRKLEAVMGIAGHGLYVDDYLIRNFDETIFYGRSLYQGLPHGIAKIGGDAIYVRAGTLAVATAILTDGVTVSAVNEDRRSKPLVAGWKAWALRTISEGAYSSSHSPVMCAEPLYKIRLQDFQIVALWESFVSYCEHLQGKSYINLSVLRSTEWKSSSTWDGVIEWLGMIPESCVINERNEIMEFLRRNTTVEIFATPTCHVASLLTLDFDKDVEEKGIKYKRVLAVDLSRFSTGMRGHVTAVAEATGLWSGRIKLEPLHIGYIFKPDKDQKVFIDSNGNIDFDYQSPKAFGTLHVLIYGLRFVINTFLMLNGKKPIGKKKKEKGNLFSKSPWPWVDRSSIGEGLFDNLLMHGLYQSGIKKQYRKLISVPYDELGWS